PGRRAVRRREADRVDRVRARKALTVLGVAGQYAATRRVLCRGSTPARTGRRNAMRPVRFVALSEDGQAFVLADEVGRLLALPIDERIATALRPSGGTGVALAPNPVTHDSEASLSPRDIQARIRSGESAEDVARVAG